MSSVASAGVGLGEPVAVEILDRRAGGLTESGLDDLFEGTLAQAGGKLPCLLYTSDAADE